MNVKVVEYDLPQLNQLAEDYVQAEEQALSFFHYHPFQQESYQRRYEELVYRSFPRKELTAVIRRELAGWGLTAAQEENLRKLEREDSVVVIGGQQAGLLTGPLYTVYKAITILKVAEEQEEKLGVPVIPLFWVAGEDHDFQEINHLYLPISAGAGVEKLSLSEPSDQVRQSIDQRPFPREEVAALIDQLFKKMQETEFTSEVREIISETLDRSCSYTQFFTGLMHRFFACHGLLFINSAARELRRMEGDVFSLIIRQYDVIDQKVRERAEKLEAKGYIPQVKLGPYPALLFIYEDDQRLLLEKRGTQFITKDGQHAYSEVELLQAARETPWRFSNNVITRPLMQESLIPTLAFVAGPGEVAYWALYGTYFQSLQLKMPILIPRLNLTLIEPHIASILEKHQIDIGTVFGHMGSFRNQWLMAQDQLQLEESFATLRKDVKLLYQPIIDKVGQINTGMRELGVKNLGKVLEQVEYLEKRSLAAFKKQHSAALRQFDKAEQALYPDGSFQERMYHPFYFFNKHGFQLLEVLMEQPFVANGRHKLVYLQAN